MIKGNMIGPGIGQFIGITRPTTGPLTTAVQHGDWSSVELNIEGTL